MKKTSKKSIKKSVRRTSPRKVQRGLSKVVVLAIIGGVLVLGGGAYYFANQGSGGGLSKALPMVKAPLNADCEYKDPELCKFINNWPNMTDYTVTTNASMQGFTTEAVYQISGEDKFRMVTKQNGKENYNIITIGDTTYTLDYSDNKWWKSTSKPAEGEVNPEQEAKEQIDFKTDASEKVTYKFIAKEPCGDLTCFKYESIVPGESEYKQFIYFDDKEYLVRKMRIEGKEGANDSVFTYDSPAITAPSPVKEGNPYGTNSMPGAGPGMSEEDVQKMMEQYQNAQGEQSSMPEDSEENSY